MTKTEKALAIQGVGEMVWGGAMLMDAAIWFVGGLFKVDWFDAREMVHDAMAEAMTDMIDKNLARMGNENA